MVRIGDKGINAQISTLGAELRQFSFLGRKLLWTRRPSLWDGTAPILFPIIGRAVGDELRIKGQVFQMPMHGFAMTSRFALVEHTPASCTLELRSDNATLASYPYRFALRINYRLNDETLSVITEISNHGDEIMPASLGLHPGFSWPLVAGVPKEKHSITFCEPGPIQYTRPLNQFVGPDRFELPLEGKTFRLNEALFAKCGLALLDLKARSLCFHTVDKSAAIRLDFPDFDRIILWSKPGCNFLCIEPLLGQADPLGFAGDIMEKPGMAHINPSDTLTLRVAITPKVGPAGSQYR